MDKKEIGLIAPCGIFCGICGGYLAYSRKIPKKRNKIIHCMGCRSRNKQCAYLKKNCPKLLKNEILFCYECQQYPCKRLRHLDERYRLDYKHSLIKNLEEIKLKGISVFLKNIKRRYKCAKCGGTICVHSGICYDCEQSKLLSTNFKESTK